MLRQELGGRSPIDRVQNPSHPVLLNLGERKIEKISAVMALITSFESQAASFPEILNQIRF
jgi:hypothetical protein